MGSNSVNLIIESPIIMFLAQNDQVTTFFPGKRNVLYLPNLIGEAC